MNDTHHARAEGSPGAYFISATASLADQQARTLKTGDTFALFGRAGDATDGPGGAEGIYHRDTRYLSRLELRIEGLAPMLLSSAVSSDNAMLSCDLSNPDLPDQGENLQEGMEHGQIHIRRAKFLWHGTCHERLSVRSYLAQTARIRLTISFAADFADLFEVRGMKRLRHGQIQAPEIAPGEVTLAYEGLDSVRRATLLRFDPPPNRLTGDHADYELTLQPGKQVTLALAINCCEAGAVAQPASPDGFLPAMRAARRALRQAQLGWATVESDNELFDEAMRRAGADLRMLVTQTEDGPYPYAGIPWFSTAFGRDAIITGLETIWLAPCLARGVLFYLAANQATHEDPAADAEPGKILHEVRHGEMALLGEVPFRRYYGSVDSTPLFVMLAGAYFERTGDLAAMRMLWPNILAALKWIDTYGDADGDGFVEYGRKAESGLANQGWKDSADSIFHADGHLATGPIALAEVQAYVFGAKRAAALVAAALGENACAGALSAQAADVQTRFEREFWDEALGSYALALDGHKQPCRVLASNAGHVLFTGLASPDRAARVVTSLLGSHFFSGWGIRTIAVGEARYNPISYHNGSVWPHDNALIAAGFARYGGRAEAARVLTSLFGAASHAELQRLPELFCGFARMRNQGPTGYPVACAPQAWAAAALPAILGACIGITFDPAARAVSFNNPLLPPFMNRLRLRNLAIGDATIDIVLHRVEGGAVAMAVTDRRGDIRATMTS
jgi:glycogen debranching enzyme